MLHWLNLYLICGKNNWKYADCKPAIKSHFGVYAISKLLTEYMVSLNDMARYSNQELFWVLVDGFL